MSILKRLQQRAEESQASSLFFLNENGTLHEALSFKELYQQAAGLAKELSATAKVGDCVWLLFEHSPAFLKSFYACMMARLTAIPIAPPDETRGAHAFEALRPLANKTKPRWVLAHEPLLSNLRQMPFLDQGSQFLEPSHAQPLADPEFETDADDRVALLFTSGSTSQPKGVSLRTRHLEYNAHQCCDLWDIQSDAVLVSWMPNHHSFGMVFNALLPVWSGARWVGMAPQTFLAKPALWLQTIDQYAGTHSAAATFGYQYAADHIRPAEIENLSLSSWRVGLVSAEPVRRGVYQTFLEKFGHLGLDPSFFSPLYGLSESGPITGHPPKKLPTFLEQAELPPHLHLASVGHAMPETQIRIVDGQAELALPEGEIGEIWIHGPSVLNRYFENDQANREAFRVLPGEGGHFFRTGDLGFCQDGELYITGRLKELIIIAGKNFVPQDIEWSFLQGHHLLNGFTAAAFSSGEGTETRVFLALEKPRVQHDQITDWHSVLAEGMLAVWRLLGLRVDSVFLLEAGQLPRTNSGKLRRNHTQELLDLGQLEVQLTYRNTMTRNEDASVNEPEQAFQNTAVPEDVDQLADQIASLLAQLLDVAESEIGLETSLSAFQLSSLQIMTFAKRLETELDMEVQPALLFKCDNLMELSELLVDQGRPAEGV